MNNRVKKIGLEVYGLLRMALGLAQLVGLCFSYFLLEFWVTYPAGELIRVFDQDVLALIFLAVILRGVFHLIVGIGLARLRTWVNYWIVWGWLILTIVNLGVLFVHLQAFQVFGSAAGLQEVVHWGHLLVYCLLVIFDGSVVAALVAGFESDSVVEDAGGRLPGKAVFGVFVGIGIFFCAILFLGKPLSQGFHQGFYKSRGKVSASAPVKEVLVPKRQPLQGSQTVRSAEATVLVEAKRTILPIDARVQTGGLKKIKGAQKSLVKGVSYRMIIGVFSASGIVLGLLFQLFSLGVKGPGVGSLGSNPGLTVGYFLQAAGFLLGAVFFWGTNFSVVVGTACVSFCVATGIVARLISQR